MRRHDAIPTVRREGEEAAEVPPQEEQRKLWPLPPTKLFVGPAEPSKPNEFCTLELHSKGRQITYQMY